MTTDYATATSKLSAAVASLLEEDGLNLSDVIVALEDQVLACKTKLDVKAVEEPLPDAGDDVASLKKLRIVASPVKDVGLNKERFGNFADKLQQCQAEKMHNLTIVPNDQGLVVSPYEDHPAASELFILSGEWKIQDQKRNYVLIMEDMQQGYHQWVDYVAPNCAKLLECFRARDLPVVWTNWSRRQDDQMYGALDRFYGPRGVSGTEHGEANPCYIYGDSPDDTVPMLEPKTAAEYSRTIVSYHLSKWADLDAAGREILYPMLEAWGVNTIVLVGAWTDDCLAATAFEAADRYGYDVILVTDGCATATVNGGKMLECLQGACCVGYTAQQVCDFIAENPELVEKPKAPLRGDVRFLSPEQRR